MPHRRRRLGLALALAALVAAPACSRAPDPNAGTDALTGPNGVQGAPEQPGQQGTDTAQASGAPAPGTAGAPGAAPGGTGIAPGTVSGGAGSGTGGAAGGQPAGGSAGGPAGGGGGGGAPAARSTLFTPAEDRIGITSNQITMCAHAALTYGAAFQTSDEDFNVFWTAINAQGGIYGRKVVVTYENDDYKPTTAVTAARACKAKNPFILLGGIGFDQIPAVRNYVEEQHMLYLHHTATVKGSKGLKYSFTSLPSVERTGEAFAQLYLSKYKGKKLGLIKRDGENWEPGVVAFKQYSGIKPVAERAVPQNKGNYTEEILAMKNAGAEVVWLWENALGATQIVKQFKAQNYSPAMMLFPFNLTSQTLEGDALNPPLDGVAMFTAYSKGDRSGPFAAYADDLTLFEQQYAKYKPDVDLNGVGGDLLFLNWQAQKALYHMLLDCGKDCTRNRFVDVLTSYKKRPTSSVCEIDFTQGDRRHGSDKLVFMQTYKSPSGKVNWRNTKMCVGRS